MIADLNTMPRMFWYCNEHYFNHELPTPKYGVLHSYKTLGRFSYNHGDKHKPVKKRYRAIFMSDYFDFDEETFRNIMVHEMIHYYLFLKGVSDCSTARRFLRFFSFKDYDHGSEFMAMAQKLNEKYGLSITKTHDASHISSAPGAPKRSK